MRGGRASFKDSPIIDTYIVQNVHTLKINKQTYLVIEEPLEILILYIFVSEQYFLNVS